MRRLITVSTAACAALLIATSAGVFAQAPAGGSGGPGGGRGRGRGPFIGGPGSPTADGSRAVTDGGVKAAGWSGKVDANEAKAGMTINDAKFEESGGKIHVTTGPASTFWKTDDKATGDFTVKASFTEPKYMNLNTHPHPYGVFIAGNDMGTENQSQFYCAAYGNGNFIVRGFGPAVFNMNGRGEANAAVHKAEGPGQPVSQDVALSVKGDKVECSINGTVVARYDKSAIVGDGKLKSTDGAYGLRFAHNTDVEVTNFSVTKN
ncbi:MAG TPA: hypothetical protein VHC90_15385 [Bryobacteraceae bacterium]|nr:hypothetical protein [Bryobacteraceae bacterium]